MTFEALDAWWWPYLFILAAGWLATDSWRFLGVLIGDRISETSEIMVLVRTVATALVAAVIGDLIVFPSGELAGSTLLLRAASIAVGFAVYLAAGNRIVAGILAAEAVLIPGLYFGF